MVIKLTQDKRLRACLVSHFRWIFGGRMKFAPKLRTVRRYVTSFQASKDAAARFSLKHTGVLTN